VSPPEIPDQVTDQAEIGEGQSALGGGEDCHEWAIKHRQAQGPDIAANLEKKEIE
jgi:hypothetical protein